MTARQLAALLLVLLAACGGPTHPTAGAAQSSAAGAAADGGHGEDSSEGARPAGASLVFDVVPGDATVMVDGEPVGVAAAVAESGALAVEAGLHTITISREGFQTWRTEIAVKDGPEQIVVRLEPKE